MMQQLDALKACMRDIQTRFLALASAIADLAPKAKKGG